MGRVVLGSLSSSKNGCSRPSIGLRRCSGGYTSKRDTRSIASGGVRDRNTYQMLINPQISTGMDMCEQFRCER